ncbi:DUF5000 domain-containing lipoprotein [Desertivirga xinjiangensis]|uniref:DUF5000 domain-containing lipoprotein n=1 Tax=Desertivirga xinjiangensis TaxID=539206 RepID=UPI002109745B|nr:DUF5000 domain-containing lipoprotein [Pedobacter xinjiangensis]
MKRNLQYSTIRIFYLAIFLLTAITGCKEDNGYNDPVTGDKTKPGTITNVKIDNFNGGAHITYDLPNSKNLLYVLAKYKINDQTGRETKSSYYSDSITVEGFANNQEYEITLYAVTRANIMSDPVTVKVHPLTPYYKLIKPTVIATPDFGGINITASNPNRQPVGMILLALDSATNTLEIEDQHYTNIDDIKYSVRGYSPVDRKFGVYVTDRFGNNSDTTVVTIRPLPESLINKNLFFTYRLPSDADLYPGWNVENLWNNKTDDYSAGWHTQSSSKGFPIIATFGLGQSVKFSRFLLFNRPGGYSYSHGNPKVFTLWGSTKNQPADTPLPRTSPEGTVVGDWVNMGNFEFPSPPSGLAPGAANAADQAYVAAGVDFNVPISSPAVKFVRFAVAQTWGGGDFAHTMELTFYGNPQ